MKRVLLLGAAAFFLASCGGKAPGTHPIPGVVGQPYETAVGRFAVRGFCVGTVNAVRSDASLGTVLRQWPKPGLRALPGYQVGVEISKGDVAGSIAGRLHAAPRPCDGTLYMDAPCDASGLPACEQERLAR